MEDFRTAGEKWNIWKIDAKGNLTVWLGSITDPKTAFEWLDSRNLDRSKHRVNNVPPQNGRTQNPEHELFAPTATKVKQGNDMAKREITGKTDRDGTKRRWVKDNRGIKRSVTDSPFNHPVPGGRKSAPALKPVPDTKEMKEMKADAKVILDKHKADEKADLEAEAEGSTNAVPYSAQSRSTCEA